MQKEISGGVFLLVFDETNADSEEEVELEVVWMRHEVVIQPCPAIIRKAAPVAQLDRVTASEAVGCAFEPRRAQNQLTN